MNRAFVFAAGVVVAGVTARLLAGSPSSPGVIHYLDAIGDDRQLVPLITRPEWSATVVKSHVNDVGRVIHVGPRLVHKVVLDTWNASYSNAWIYDSNDPSDLSTPITFLSSYVNAGAVASQVELDVRVTKGVLVVASAGGACTVLHGE